MNKFGKMMIMLLSWWETYGFKTIGEAEKFNISQFNPEDWTKLISRLKREHKIKGHITTHQRPDGREIHIIANLVAMNDESGQFNKVKGYIFEND